jgi:ribonuclease HI
VQLLLKSHRNFLTPHFLLYICEEDLEMVLFSCQYQHAFHSSEEVWKLVDRNWSPQCKVVIKASLINIFSTIWFVKNQARFNDKLIPWRTAINLVISSVALSGNLSRVFGHCPIQDFSILKHFNIKVHPPNAPTIKEVLWSPPPFSRIKYNTDGSSISNQMQSSCGGIFRNNMADCLGCFATNQGQGSTLMAEFIAAMTAIETAFDKSWRNLWLETDSKVVMLAFSSSFLVPWCIQNRWANCLLKTRQMNFIVSHIYREGNTCADLLAEIGLGINGSLWWDNVPGVIRQEVIRNKLGLPNYRFLNF